MLLAVMLLEAMMLLNLRKKSRKRQVWKMLLICSEVTVVMEETTKSIKVLNAIKSVHVSSMHAMDVIEKFLSNGQIHLLIFTSPIKELYTNFRYFDIPRTPSRVCRPSCDIVLLFNKQIAIHTILMTAYHIHDHLLTILEKINVRLFLKLL